MNTEYTTQEQEEYEKLREEALEESVLNEDRCYPPIRFNSLSNGPLPFVIDMSKCIYK